MHRYHRGCLTLVVASVLLGSGCQDNPTVAPLPNRSNNAPPTSEPAPQDMASSCRAGAPINDLADPCARDDGSFSCGTVSFFDECGEQLNIDCGVCAPGFECLQNVCECLLEELPSDAEICARRGVDCGELEYIDSCGGEHEVWCGECDDGACDEGVCVGYEPGCDAYLCELFELSCGALPEEAACPGSPQDLCGVCAEGDQCVSGRCVASAACRPPDPASYCQTEEGSACGSVSVMGCDGPTQLTCSSCSNTSCKTECSDIVLTDPTARQDDRFGASLAAPSGAIAVGAPGKGNINQRGAVFVYALDGQLVSPPTILYAPTSTGNEFGATLAAHEDTLAVGSPGAPSTVVMFARDEVTGQWEQTDILDEPAQFSGRAFGRALAAGPAHVLVGAPSSPLSTSTPESLETGCAYLYTIEEDGLATLYQRFDSLDSVEYGASVAIDPLHTPPLIAIGAPDADNGAGRVELFALSQGEWLPHATIQPPTGARATRFGASISLRDGDVLIGAPGASATDVSAVYLATPSPDRAYTPHLLLEAGASTANALGRSVWLTGAHAVASDPDAPQGGAVYRVDLSDLDTLATTKQQPLTLKTPSAGLGTSIIGNERVTITGAPGTATNGAITGAVFVFIH